MLAAGEKQQQRGAENFIGKVRKREKFSLQLRDLTGVRYCVRRVLNSLPKCSENTVIVVATRGGGEANATRYCEVLRWPRVLL
jgi:hypothetical protein